MDFSDTICAISSPAGAGAIAVIRISGEKAFAICDTIIQFTDRSKKLLTSNPNSIHLGTVLEYEEPVDEVVIGIFRKPHSYTGEDIVEISCHGSQYIQQKVLQILITAGARLARPGEFTLRAFLNGKLDLSQAEGVADMIASNSAAAHKMAFRQMKGSFSEEIKRLRHELLQFISLIELELDFSEEDVEFADRKEFNNLVSRILEYVSKLIQSFEYGNVIKNGIPVAIIGQSNSGKSTLLNRLLHDEKAIVSPIAGTTRDFIEDTILLKGVQFRFIDTAGLRHATDIIENEGIRRTFKKYKQASIVIVVIDIIEDIKEVEKALSFLGEDATQLSDQILVFALNKMDTIEEKDVKRIFSDYLKIWSDMGKVICISAKNGNGVSDLENLLVDSALNNTPAETEVVVTNIRHLEALKNTSEALIRVLEALNSSVSVDFISQDIREALHYLGEITGEITTDEILGNIFKNFCIGK
jgi:tRNA modification GTPase